MEKEEHLKRLDRLRTAQNAEAWSPTLSLRHIITIIIIIIIIEIYMTKLFQSEIVKAFKSTDKLKRLARKVPYFCYVLAQR